MTKRLWGKTISAAVGGLLLLSLSAVPSVQRAGESVAAGRAEKLGAIAARDPSPRLADDDIANQGRKCEDMPSHDETYPGPSASQTYDHTFFQLGADKHPIPYLEEKFTPQGLAHWANWNGRGDDLLLVTAYKRDQRSRIYGIAADTGKTVGTVDIDEDHVGGIVVLRDWAFVSGKRVANPHGDEFRTIRKYDLGELRSKLKEEGRPYLGQDFPANDVKRSAFLGTDGSILYAGEYDKKNRTPMDAYAVRDDGSLRELDRNIEVPKATQGMTVVDKGFLYSVSSDHDDGLRSYLYLADRDSMDYEPILCFRAPSMSEGLATYGDRTYLLFESGSAKFTKQVNKIKHLHVGSGEWMNDDGGGGDRTTLTYTGPSEADFHDSFTASARLTTAAGPVSGMDVEFVLGGGGRSQSCRDATNGDGVASCRLRPTGTIGTTTLTVRFAGGGGLQASSDTATFTVTRQETALRYTGPEKVANGTPARLSGVLTEESTDGPPVEGRSVTLALGEGEHRQACTDTTDGDGVARCTIDTVNQPLNADATVPMTSDFDGDTFYEPSTGRDTVLLEYYTGRSYGLAADLGLPGLSAGLTPTPDTGQVRTARATMTAPACVADQSLVLLGARALCPSVVTSLAPGTSRATTTVQDAGIGLPGLPVIEVDGATARSTSTCGSGGSATGSTDLTLRIGGELVEVTGEANAVVDLPGLAKLVVNEQVPVRGADHGLTVNAVHLTMADGTADVVIASATSDVHNCAS
jgi:hypothetical protein